MKPYKKRALGNWDDTSKKTNFRNRRERNYAKREVREALEDHTEHPEYEVPINSSLPVRSSFSVFLADFKARLGL